MTGILEVVLRRRYGVPLEKVNEERRTLIWNPDSPYRCKVYRNSHLLIESKSPDIRQFYGDSCGGSLLHGSIKVSSIGDNIYGIWLLDDLVRQPEVIKARAIDSSIQFFMDSSNVWFYGAKNGDLWQYDAETDELTNRGTLEQALVSLLVRWERTKER